MADVADDVAPPLAGGDPELLPGGVPEFDAPACPWPVPKAGSGR